MPNPDLENSLDTRPEIDTPTGIGREGEGGRDTGISPLSHPLSPHPPGSLALPGPESARPDPATVFLTGYVSENSRRAMASSLCVVASLLSGEDVTDPRTVPWHQLRYEHVNALRAKLAGLYASTSANRHLTALRGVMKSCWRLGIIEREVYDRIADVALLKASRPEAGRALSEEEVAKLFDACRPQHLTDTNRRDEGVLAVMLGCGLRRSEVCELDCASYVAETGALTVHGKGDKYRVVYVPPKSRARLDSWLRVRGSEAGPLFCPFNMLGEPRVMTRLSHQGLTVILEHVAKRAGVADFTPHDLRRTYITRLLEKGADPLVVSKLAGHASVQTTMRYDKRGEKAKEAATSLLDF